MIAYEFRAARRQIGNDAADRRAAGNIELGERVNLVARIFAQLAKRILALKQAHAAPRPGQTDHLTCTSNRKLFIALSAKPCRYCDADWRFLFSDGLRDCHRRACARTRGARLRITVRMRAHPHSGEPPHAVSRRWRASQALLAHP